MLVRRVFDRAPRNASTWVKTLQSNEELVHKYRAMRHDKEQYAVRCSQINQKNKDLLLENAELRSENRRLAERPSGSLQGKLMSLSPKGNLSCVLRAATNHRPYTFVAFD